MSAEIINLRQARKQKSRQDKEKAAEDNRRKFGRSKAERTAARKRREDLESKVDGHFLEGAKALQDADTTKDPND